MDDGRVRCDREAYRRRSVVEQRVGRLEEGRAAATRFDGLAVDYPAAMGRAVARRYSRLLTA